jgi:hypothetical protein
MGSQLASEGPLVSVLVSFRVSVRLVVVPGHGRVEIGKCRLQLGQVDVVRVVVLVHRIMQLDQRRASLATFLGRLDAIEKLTFTHASGSYGPSHDQQLTCSSPAHDDEGTGSAVP